MSRGGSIKKDTAGYYFVVDIARKGEPRKQLKRRFKTYRTARAGLTKLLGELAEGSFVQPDRMTVQHWIEKWVPVLRTQVRPSTAASYERNLRLHLLPTLGPCQLQSLRAADLTALYAQLLVSGRLNHRRESIGGLSHRSVSYLHTIVGKALEAAVRGEYLATNPARRADVPKAAATAGSKVPKKTWTSEELGAFLAGSTTHRHHAAWLLLATTGLRRGETLGLVWSALDLDGDRLQVTRTLVDVDHGEPIWSLPKTNRGRRQIGLDPGTVRVLRAHRAAQAETRLAVGAGYRSLDLVFAAPDGGPVHPDRFSRSFIEQGTRLGLSRLNVHGLRHTWATLALQAGVHPKVVQERLGHSTISITLDTYSHVMPSMDTDAADRVAALILGIP